MVQYTFQIKALKSGYMAFCPAMRPVKVFAKTEEAAIKKMDVAVGLYVQRHPDIVKNLRSSSIGD